MDSEKEDRLIAEERLKNLWFEKIMRKSTLELTNDLKSNKLTSTNQSIHNLSIRKDLMKKKSTNSKFDINTNAEIPDDTDKSVNLPNNMNPEIYPNVTKLLKSKSHNVGENEMRDIRKVPDFKKNSMESNNSVNENNINEIKKQSPIITQNNYDYYNQKKGPLSFSHISEKTDYDLSESEKNIEEKKVHEVKKKEEK